LFDVGDYVNQFTAKKEMLLVDLYFCSKEVFYRIESLYHVYSVGWPRTVTANM